MVCADEIPAEALRDEELFKTMSAHGGVEMRGMHKDEDTANRWRPKLILAANDGPRYKDNEASFQAAVLARMNVAGQGGPGG
jgi:hypothetical protein